MPIDPLQRPNWIPVGKNSKVLTEKSFRDLVKLLFNLIWGDFCTLRQTLYWAKSMQPGKNQMFATSADDLFWFLNNLLIGGYLEIWTRGPRGHGWTLFKSDYDHWMDSLLGGEKGRDERGAAILRQDKARQKGLFIKARRTRSRSSSLMNLRIPHK